MVTRKDSQQKDQIQDSEQEQAEPEHEEQGFQDDDQYFHGTEFHRGVLGNR